RRAPDSGEGLLSCVLGAAVVPELSQRHREHRAREALVELLEGFAVSAPDALDEPTVALGCCHCRRHTDSGYGCKATTDSRVSAAALCCGLRHALDRRIACGRELEDQVSERPPSMNSVEPVTNPAPTR